MLYETGLTPCELQEQGFCAKREDLACFIDEATPSGAKVRQYAAMIAAAPADAVLAVGCSAASAMQIYVAAMGERLKRAAYIAVPKRAKMHPCTKWAQEHGAQVLETVPGYPSVFRARIRERMHALGLTPVQWSVGWALFDTAKQVANLPMDARRVVVPNGSGLTAAGIIGGLYLACRLRRTQVHIVSTHDSVGTPSQVLSLVSRYFGSMAAQYANISWRPQTMPYHKQMHGTLDDGTPLDPYYAAKAVGYCGEYDVLWITGRRPLASCRPKSGDFGG